MTSRARKKTQHNKIYPSVDALAADLGISRQSAYNGLNAGTIPAIRLNKRFIISRAAIDEWLKNSGRSAVA